MSFLTLKMGVPTPPIELNAAVATVNSQLASKADTSFVNSELSLKADISYVDQKDAAINNELATKASLTSVGIGLQTKVDNSEYTATINSVNNSLSAINTTLSQKSNLSQTIRNDVSGMQTVSYLSSGSIRSATHYTALQSTPTPT